MNILIIGSGGREHAVAWKLSQSPRLGKLFIAPGNAGTDQSGINLPVDPLDFEAVRTAVLEHQVEMVVAGPEEPLVKGLGDFFRTQKDLQHIGFVGPGKAGAQLEGSKDFAKAFMQRHGIPTASYRSFLQSEWEAARTYLDSVAPPYVIKADGLAAGKGVLICTNKQDAEQALEDMMVKEKFGAAGKKVVIEAFLRGIELSVFVATDGSHYKILPSAKDYKRIGEGDTGLNTGGMGAISPVPFSDDAFMEKVEKRIIIPTIGGLKKDNIPYRGFLFIGLMNVDGDPFVIEYNVRLGDPETEVIMPRIGSDLVDLLEGIARGNLAEVPFEISDETAVTVMLVSGGYPEAYEKGKEIKGPLQENGSLIFHAGTRRDPDTGAVVTNGGRVLAVTSLGAGMRQVLEASYSRIRGISFEGMYYRKDIGFDLIPENEK